MLLGPAMADLPDPPGRTPRVQVSTVIPARRMSLGEEEAFPITKTEIQAPPIPEKMEEALGESSSAPPPNRKNLVAIAFVVVAAIGALAAVRFFIAASHDTPAVQE